MTAENSWMRLCVERALVSRMTLLSRGRLIVIRSFGQGGRLTGVLPAVDEEFLDSAPSRFVDRFEIALPASAVWDELTRDQTLDWCRGLQIAWLSTRPFGLGTRRQARLMGLMLRVDEEYFLWEEGRRKAFYVRSVRPPAYRRSAEDYLVEPLGPDRCRFTWTLAFELTMLGRLNAPLSSVIVKRMFSDTRRHFAQLATRR